MCLHFRQCRWLSSFPSKSKPRRTYLVPKRRELVRDSRVMVYDLYNPAWVLFRAVDTDDDGTASVDGTRISTVPAKPEIVFSNQGLISLFSDAVTSGVDKCRLNQYRSSISVVESVSVLLEADR